MRDVMRLADTAAAHMTGPPMRVIVDGLGRYWLTYAGGNSLPLVYRADGRFIRELGPRGDGPGEWRAPAFVMPVPGDSVVVYDSRRGTLSVLDADFEVRRTIASPPSSPPYSLLVFDWPRMVFSKQPGRVELGPVYIPRPFQILDLSGPTASAIRSFGGGFDFGVTEAGPYSVWTWDYNPYRIERWNSSGEISTVIERHPAWFPEAERPPLLPDAMPPGHLQGVHQDAEGRVWVFVNVPTKVWVRGTPLGNAMHEYFRTRVEIFDPAAGRMIATADLEAWVVAPLPGLRAAAYGTTPQGTPYVQIVQLALVP
jgi:hypothetical protein